MGNRLENHVGVEGVKKVRRGIDIIRSSRRGGSWGVSLDVVAGLLGLSQTIATIGVRLDSESTTEMQLNCK